MKSKTVAVGFFVAILLSGCSTTTHMFEFYGETHESDGRDFFYVEYSVTGSATAGYSWAGGGNVRDGLIADAKRNLIMSHPLGPNQSYVNMSIDISTTNYTALFFFNGRVELTATVSADVIQFGAPPVNYEIPVAGSNSSIAGKVLPQPSEKDGMERREPEADVRPVKIVGGSKVLCKFKGDWFSGVVVAQSSSGYRVKFDVSGKTTTKWFYASEVRLND